MAQGMNPGLIPTGYGQQEAEIASKRRLAEAMLQQGLAGPGANARSPFQLLGTLAQAWAGRSGQKDADKLQGSLDQQKLADQAAAVEGLKTALANAQGDPSKLDPTVMSNPRLQGNPLAGIMLDAWKAQMLNKGEITGDPLEMRGPGGNFISGSRTKAGGFLPFEGGLQMAPKIENVNGMAVDLQHQAPGAVLPQDLGNEVIYGADGKPTTNNQLVGAKKDVAAAGRSQNNTFVNMPPVERAYDVAIGGEAGKSDAAILGAAVGAGKVYNTGSNILKALDSGAIVGTGAGFRAGLNKALATAGLIDGKTVANTEMLLKNQAQAALDVATSAGLGSKMFDSNAEKELLARAAAGTIDMTPAGIRATARALQNTARNMAKAGVAVTDQMAKNPGTANFAQGYRQRIPTFTEDTPSGFKPKITRIK